MSNMRLLSVVLMFAFACNGVFSQNVLTSKEKAHQSELNTALRNAGFASSISNNSVFFKRDNVTYWITLRCPDTMSDVEFSINRGGYKLGADNYDRDIALLVCNEVNRKFPLVKIYCEKSRVAICIQTCASGGKELAALMNSYLKAFEGVKDCFEEEYAKLAAASSDGEEAKKRPKDAQWSADESKAVVETSASASALAPVATEQKHADSEQKPTEQKPVVAEAQRAEPTPLSITGFAARGVSPTGVMKEYGKPILGFNSSFLQPRITMSSKEKGTYRIDMKVYAPDGSIILWNPLADKEYSYSKDIEVKKRKKPVDYEMDQLGTGGIAEYWSPGEYRFEFWHKGQKLYEATQMVQ